jgi:hypothetical protein
MKTSPSKRHLAGYISFLLVLSTGTILTFLMFFAYSRALSTQMVESQVQTRLDYSEKDEAILRSIVAITPNRAIRAMQPGSNATGVSEPLSWQDIFTEALVLANARTSISDGANGSPNLLAALNIPTADLERAKARNSAALNDPVKIFAAIHPDSLVNSTVLTTRAKGYVSVGINRNLVGTGFPPALTTSDTTVTSRDLAYPIIATSKVYGTLAQPSLDSKTMNGDGTTAYGLSATTYPGFNRLKYPNINFGYAKPGEPFVAKRNWWAFSVDAGGNERDNSTFLAHSKREFVLSIYEIPSQLSISAASFMSLGQYASGDAWQNYNIDGGMFVGKAEVTGTTPLKALALRRGMTISNSSSIGGKSFSRSPFTPGDRESFLDDEDRKVPVSLVNQTTLGAFFPVSLASESGRAAFIPINRGAAFFDRFDPNVTVNDPVETTGARNHVAANVLSSTSWNNYTIGAQQCAMRMDIIQVQSSTNPTPTMLRFQYYLANGNRASMRMPLNSAVLTSLPSGYVSVAIEDESVNLSTLDAGRPVDVAYGESGGFTFRQSLGGTITFNNSTFGDPLVGTRKKGYWRPRSPYEIKTLTGGQMCVSVYPERMPSFLATIGAAGPAVNNSLVVNVDYSVSGLNNSARKPAIPCTANDYGVILKECADLTPFTKGFSLVTNLRLYIGDDFNTVAATPPSGYTPAVTASNPTGRYLPPCSLFTPEKRYGVEVDPFAVNLGGQIGSLAKVDKVNSGDAEAPMIRPLDSKALSGNAIASDRITVNLSQIRHPAELPPITMMNWLVLLEERRK